MTRALIDGPGPGEVSLSVVVPTFGRERVLLETLGALLRLEEPADEILVVDQTAEHDAETVTALSTWDSAGDIRWIRREHPSIPKAMNAGLRAARSEVVLFLDDDIVPGAELVAAHRKAHEETDVAAITGMVLQPGEEPLDGASPSQEVRGLRRDLEFCFRMTARADVWNVMAGNLSVKRGAALECGGFDEKFVGVAYRFETEFCRRLRRYGGRVKYEPAAIIRHLKAPAGGTRSWGHHQTSSRPEHSVGDYYFALKEGQGSEVAAYVLRRLRQETLSRFHLAHPWYIPVKALAEVRGLLMALRLVWGKRQSG